MRVVIANFRPPLAKPADFPEWWSSQARPRKKDRYERLLDYSAGWGFHIFAIGLHMMDLGLADDVEFWVARATRWVARTTTMPNAISSTTPDSSTTGPCCTCRW